MNLNVQQSNRDEFMENSSRVSGSYWAKRFDYMYYKYIDKLVLELGKPGDSLLDVGSNGCPYIEKFTWAAERVSIDLRKPYKSENVTGITADFYAWTPPRKFTIVLCLQVLEHLNEPESFVRKLFTCAGHVIISVPYKWPKGVCKYHVQDPIDGTKLKRWAGRDPSIQLVVPELKPSKKSKRLIAYYKID